MLSSDDVHDIVVGFRLYMMGVSSSKMSGIIKMYAYVLKMSGLQNLGRL